MRLLTAGARYRGTRYGLLLVASEEVCERLRAQRFEARAAGSPSVNMIEHFPELLPMAESERPELAFSKIFGTRAQHRCSMSCCCSRGNGNRIS